MVVCSRQEQSLPTSLYIKTYKAPLLLQVAFSIYFPICLGHRAVIQTHVVLCEAHPCVFCPAGVVRQRPAKKKPCCNTVTIIFPVTLSPTARVELQSMPTSPKTNTKYSRMCWMLCIFQLCSYTSNSSPCHKLYRTLIDILLNFGIARCTLLAVVQPPDHYSQTSPSLVQARCSGSPTYACCFRPDHLSISAANAGDGWYSHAFCSGGLLLKVWMCKTHCAD